MLGITYRVVAMTAATIISITVSIPVRCQVSVTGSGSVGVQTMTGGNITVVGITASEAKALAAATGQELLTRLDALVRRINSQFADRARADQLSLGVVQGFLATVKGKQIPLQDWPITFGELTRQYLTLGEQIQATPITSDSLRRLISDADVARRSGQLQLADELLAQAVELATQDALKQAEAARLANRQAASLLASRAALAFLRLDRERAATLLERAADLRSADPSPETVQWMLEAADAWTLLGRSDAALRLSSAATAIAKVRSPSGATADWRRVLSASYDKLADAHYAKGNASDALASLLASLAIRERLLASDSATAEREQDIAISHAKIARLRAALGDRTAAIKSMEAANAIWMRLHTLQPKNTDWQRGLARSYIGLADLLHNRIPAEAVEEIYQRAIRLIKDLVAGDSHNAGLQAELATCYSRLAHNANSAGESRNAVRAYDLAVETMKLLIDADPANTQWQSTLADMLVNLGKAHEDAANWYWRVMSSDYFADKHARSAYDSYLASLAIHRSLVSADGNNATWRFAFARSSRGVYDLLPTDDIDERRKLLIEVRTVLEPLETSKTLTVFAKDWLMHARAELAKLR